jgi:acetyl-CoA acyltransferase 2
LDDDRFDNDHFVNGKRNLYHTIIIMSAVAKNIFIVGAKRTPFGSFGGSLKAWSATDLGVLATQAALQQAAGEKAASLVSDVYFGNVIASSADAAYLARHVALKSGCPVATPALTINRLCGSGFESIVQAVRAIQLNPQLDLVVAGGTENMSMAPLCLDGNIVRHGGVPLGMGLQMYDSLWSGLTDSYAGTPMGITAENLATKYNISREECNEYAIRSQQLWLKAKQNGMFDAEMVPVQVKHKKKGMITVDTDEHPRPESTLEKLNSLPPVFKKDGGVVNAANASGICDGAGSIIVASEEACQRHNLTPLARIVSYGVTGCDPTIMGIGPVEAIKTALAQVNLNLHSDIDRVEINEAFASQVLVRSSARRAFPFLVASFLTLVVLLECS